MSGNIKKLYKSSGKWNDQNQYKDIIEAAMDSKPEELTDKSPTSPHISLDGKNNSAKNHYVNSLIY